MYFDKLRELGFPNSALNLILSNISIYATDKEIALRLGVTGYLRDIMYINDKVDSTVLLMLADDTSNEVWFDNMGTVMSFFIENGLLDTD